MVNLLYTEFLKLKRSQMFIISIIGAAIAPFVCFVAFLDMKIERPDVPILMNEVFSQTNMFIVLLIGVPLYGVITAYLYNREYSENTLKNLLTIPVSRISLFISKFSLLFVWITVMTSIAWVLTVVFGIIGQFEDISTILLINTFKVYIVGGILLFLLSTPTILVTHLFKNYVTTIVFTLLITMINVLIVKSKYIALYPWTAVHVIATNSFIPDYPPGYSYISVFAAFIIGFIASIIYFMKEDIH